MEAYKQVKITKNQASTTLVNQHYSGANKEQKYGRSDQYKSGKVRHGGANRKQNYGNPDEYTSLENNITAPLTGINYPESLRWINRASYRVHKPLPRRNIGQIPLQKAVFIRHANARFLCVRRFPAAAVRLVTPIRTKNHFPWLYYGNNQSLRPRKTTFTHKS